MLNEFDGLPDGLLDAPATALESVLGGPALIHIDGQKPEPVFVSVLLHGNEVTGWEAVQEILSRYRGSVLPRAMSLFIGNPRAAAESRRSLSNQVDYNRVWPTAEGQARSGPEAAMMATVVERMRQRNVLLSIDVHNNTGRNPHYGCVTKLSPEALNLALRFAPTLLYFTRPEGVQTMAFDDLCAAVTIECGAVGSANSRLAAMDFIEGCLALDGLSAEWPAAESFDLYRSAATVRIPENSSFGFGEDLVEISFPENLETFNWTELPAGQTFAQLDSTTECPLRVTDDDGQDVAQRFFEVVDGELRTRIPVTPAMLTRDSRVIRQDCLCYLLERQTLPDAAHAS